MARVAAAALPAALLLAAPVAGARAGEVTLVVTVPEDTPAGDVIHIAGDFQGWVPGAPAWHLEKRDDGRWSIVLDPGDAPLRFKFTRGSWESVEKGPDGEEIPNRTLAPESGHETVELTVARWADIGPPGPAAKRTLTGDVFTVSFPDFLDGRRVWIYLPPDYRAETDRRYPVLYFWDGQNVFDASTSFAGEWRADETAERMIAAREIRPLILVGIDNAGAGRLYEYTPWSGPRGGGGAPEHLEAVVEVLKPAIDGLLRTLPGPEHTGVCGSSLGGLLSVYAAYAAPETFGKAAGLSVVFGWGRTLDRWCAERGKPDVRLYFDTGTREAGRLVDGDGNGVDDHVDALDRLRRVALDQGFRDGDDLMTAVEEGANHNESAWARRLPAVLAFLFPASSAPN